MSPRDDVDATAAGTLLIGAWRLDPALDELRGPDGAAVKLEPRQTRLLLALASRPGELLTHQELLDRVWAGVVVSPASLYQAVAQLRRLLGDEADAPRYIATVQRKGYRLLAPVARPAPAAEAAGAAGAAARPAPAAGEPATADPGVAAASAAAPGAPAGGPLPQPVPPRRQALGLGLGLAGGAGLLGVAGLAWMWSGLRTPAQAAPVALAVLPFEVVDSQQLEQPLADGLATSVIEQLTRHQGLKVLARDASFAYRGEADLTRLASELAASHALSGQLRREGPAQALRVDLRLQRTSDGRTEWAQRLEVRGEDLPRLPGTAARGVLAALELPPLPAVAAATPRAAAFELYLLGVNRQASMRPEGMLEARGYFQRAIDADPGFALAHAALAWTWIGEYHYGALNFRDMEARATALLDRALTLEPEQPLALGMRGHLLNISGRHEPAREALSRALALAPHHPSVLTWAARNEADAGQPAAASALYARALELAPRAYGTLVLAGLAATYAGRDAEARALYARAEQIDPRHPNAPWGLGLLGYARGQLAEAVTGLRRALELAPQRRDIRTHLAWLSLDLGEADAAGTALVQVAEQSAADPAARTGARLQLLRASLAADGPAALARGLATLDLPPQGRRYLAVEAALLHEAAGQRERSRALLAEALGLMLADPIPLANNWSIFQGHHAVLDAACLLVRHGDAERAEPLLGQVAGELEGYRACAWHALPYLQARIAAARGQADAALALLEQAVAAGWRRAWWLPHEPAFAALAAAGRLAGVAQRVAPRVAEQRQRLGLPG